MTASADWAAATASQDRRRAAILWPVAALAVAAVATAASVALRQAETRFGRPEAPPQPIYLDLDGGAGVPAMTAAPESAPAPPMTRAPRLQDPIKEAQAAPEEQAQVSRARPVPRLIAPAAPPEPVFQPPRAAPAPKAAPKRSPPKKPAPAKPKPAAPAVPVVQRATGAGVGSGQVARGDAETLKAHWGALIRARIEARARGAEAGTGTVGLRLRITRAGGLAATSVARASGNPVLDRLALRAVKTAGHFPAAPAGLSGASFDFTLSIRFRE